MINEDIIYLSDRKLLKMHHEKDGNVYGTVYAVKNETGDGKNANLSCSLSHVKTILLLQRHASNKQVKKLKLKRLFDGKYLVENVYLLADFGLEKRLYCVRSISSSSDVTISLHLEICIKTSADSDVHLCDGPVLTWVSKGKLAVATPYLEHLTDIDITPASVLKLTSRVSIFGDIDGGIECHCFLFDNQQRSQFKFKCQENACVVHRLSDNLLYVPDVFIALISCVISISSAQIPSLQGTYDDQTVFIVCTKNQQCLLFVDGSIISFCAIPSSCVASIMLYESDFSPEPFILLLTEDSIAYALSFNQHCLEVSIGCSCDKPNISGTNYSTLTVETVWHISHLVQGVLDVPIKYNRLYA